MNEFLNAFVTAFITNRTILWNFCARGPCLIDSKETCEQYLHRHSWIPSWTKVSIYINTFLLIDIDSYVLLYIHVIYI